MKPTPQHKDTTLDEILDDYVYRLKNIRTLHNAHFSKEIAKTELKKWRDKAVVEAKQQSAMNVMAQFRVDRVNHTLSTPVAEWEREMETADKTLLNYLAALKETPNED